MTQQNVATAPPAAASNGLGSIVKYFDERRWSWGSVIGGLSLWDIAAAGLIAEEGGMRVTDVAGGPWFALSMASRSIGIVAASPAHHGRFLDLIR